MRVWDADAVSAPVPVVVGVGRAENDGAAVVDAVRDAVEAGDADAVAAALTLEAADGDCVGAALGVGVGAPVCVGVAVTLAVTVPVMLGVRVVVGVADCVAAPDAVGGGDDEGVRVGLGVGVADPVDAGDPVLLCVHVLVCAAVADDVAAAVPVGDGAGVPDRVNAALVLGVGDPVGETVRVVVGETDAFGVSVAAADELDVAAPTSAAVAAANTSERPQRIPQPSEVEMGGVVMDIVLLSTGPGPGRRYQAGGRGHLNSLIGPRYPRPARRHHTTPDGVRPPLRSLPPVAKGRAGVTQQSADATFDLRIRPSFVSTWVKLRADPDSENSGCGAIVVQLWRGVRGASGAH